MQATRGVVTDLDQLRQEAYLVSAGVGGISFNCQTAHKTPRKVRMKLKGSRKDPVRQFKIKIGDDQFSCDIERGNGGLQANPQGTVTTKGGEPREESFNSFTSRRCKFSHVKKKLSTASASR